MKTQRLTIGFSPCPNDTYIFDALVNHRIERQGLEFDVVIAEVEELNQRALKGELDITKISYHVLAHASQHYVIANSGSALGFENGPLLVAKNYTGKESINAMRIAIPGQNTTANLLLGIAFPKATNKTTRLFSQIISDVLEERFDAGLLIHESRFVYEQIGLVKIIDLGEFWHNLTQLPLPLGGIAIRRNLPQNQIFLIDKLIAESLRYAHNNPQAGRDFIRLHAQETHDEVIDKHIKLFVNDFSLDLGPTGQKAILALLDAGYKSGQLPENKNNLFLNTTSNV